jgi:GDP-mannose 6-dehydrogenase
LSKEGHIVTGVDIMKDKVDAIGHGRPTVIEPDVERLIAQGHQEGRVHATHDAELAVHSTEVSLVCVGTPSGRDGALHMDYVAATAKDIGDALAEKEGRHLVVLRSTVPPGTVEELVVPTILELSGKTADEICIVIIPEFLREGTAVADYHAPPLVVVGTSEGEPEQDHAAAIADLLSVEVDHIQWVQYRQAELMKSLCNVFHALKVTFANEVGALCSEAGIDGHEVMRLLTLDRKLNISAAYLRPGMPFGGSCLPKDLAATIALANQHYVNAPLLRSIAESNEVHKRRSCEAAIRCNGHRRVGMDGLAFKADTDDLRESPMVTIAEFLIGKGYDLRIYDPAVDTARLTGTNRSFIEEHIPHLADRLVGTTDELLDHSEAIVLTRGSEELLAAAHVRPDAPQIIDLTLAGRDSLTATQESETVEQLAAATT